MKVWLVGAKGMLGQAVSRALERSSVAHVDTDLEVDVTDPKRVREFLEEQDPDWIVNCAAYTAVDQAEDEEARAYELNANAPLNLAQAARHEGAALLHISTDYVFDGELNRPYREDDPPNPRSAYGRTKLAGEEAVRSTLPEHVILRTAWLYGHQGKNFVETMLRLMTERAELSVVDDQTGSPTYADDLADAIVRIVTSHRPAYGTFHFSGAGECTWHGFAREIYQQAKEIGLLSSSCTILPVTSDEFPQKATRPRNSRLSKEKIQHTYGIVPDHWKQSLHNYLTSRSTYA
jgi:dTDP-4-dehydrorhamnose reductase